MDSILDIQKELKEKEKPVYKTLSKMSLKSYNLKKVGPPEFKPV